MIRREAISQNVFFDSEAEISIIYDVHPPRVEECHGYHTFNEDEEVDRQLISFKIMLENGLEIDITDRLTEEEKQKIVQTEL
jgi:hypothetical protein